MLVGNKCDLEEERKVTYEEASGMAKEWGCPFLETSAKSGINDKECFFEVVREIRKRDRPAKATKAKARFRCNIL